MSGGAIRPERPRYHAWSTVWIVLVALLAVAAVGAVMGWADEQEIPSPAPVTTSTGTDDSP